MELQKPFAHWESVWEGINRGFPDLLLFPSQVQPQPHFGIGELSTELAHHPAAIQKGIPPAGSCWGKLSVFKARCSHFFSVGWRWENQNLSFSFPKKPHKKEAVATSGEAEEQLSSLAAVCL